MIQIPYISSGQQIADKIVSSRHITEINNNNANFALVMKTNAGAITDSLFPNPLNGMFGVDTTNSYFYLRIGGAWKKVPVSPVGASDIGSLPGCSVHETAAQSIPTSTNTAVTFTFEQYNNVGSTMHSTTVNTSRITATTAGVYVIQGYTSFAASAAGTVRQMFLRLNGTTSITDDTRGTTAVFNQGLSVGINYKFALNDYIELVAFQDSGGSLNTGSATVTSRFSATWVST